MSERRITELRLTAFKSFRDVVLPLEAMTVLIGRNGSGKSNALEALGVLSRMARGDDLRDAVEGDSRGAEPVRGGMEGCPPYGTDSFALGVSAVVHGGSKVALDVTVQVRPRLRVDHERLVVTIDGHPSTVLETVADPEQPGASSTKVWNAVTGEHTTRMASRRSLATSEMVMVLDDSTPAEDRVATIANDFLRMLGSALDLNPRPERIRDYASESDTVLRGSASNLPAAVADLETTSPERFQRLLGVVRRLTADDVGDLEVVRTRVGDVTLALAQHIEGSTRLVPLRQISDGMLRVLAIATGVIAGGPDAVPAPDWYSQERAQLLAVEEFESGLHPSQASSLLELVVEESSRPDFQVLLTTHSPVLLDALTGDQHHGVVVVQRDPETGLSAAARLSDLPGYLRMMARGSLGSAVTSGRVTEAAQPVPETDPRSIDEILGIS